MGRLSRRKILPHRRAPELQSAGWRLRARQGDRSPPQGRFGAWEVAGRADYIDLNNEGVKGGEQISYIAGVNPYANDYVRFMLGGAVTQVFDARDTGAAVTGSRHLIYGGGLRAQVDC